MSKFCLYGNCYICAYDVSFVIKSTFCEVYVFLI